VMNADGSDQRRLARGSGPSFSPDGTKLAYGGPQEAPGIYVANVDGSGVRRLTSGLDGGPVWSPDGAQIAFVRAAAWNGPWSLDAVGTDGGDLTTIVDNVQVEALDWARASGAVTGNEPDVTADQTPCAEQLSPPPPGGGPTPVPPVMPASGPIDASLVQPPNRLVVARVAFSPAVLRSRRPFSIRLAVTEQAGRPVSGAVVRITPVNGAAKPSAQLRTDAAGGVAVRVTPTRQLRLRKGGRLALEVRVRRPGAPWSDASSGLRWISVRTA
jgi:hypothetical protein